MPLNSALEKDAQPPEPSEKFVSSDKNEKYNYTVVSFLGANLMGGTGAAQEAKEIMENLAPQIKDNSLALILLGTVKDESDQKFHVRRYEITHNGIKDTTEGISGARYANYDSYDIPRESAPEKGEKVSPYHRDTLKNFISDAMKKYPAKHYVLSLSTHGSSINGIAGDRNYDGGSWMDRYRTLDKVSLPALQGILEENRKETGKKFDVIDFDACLMGQMEVVSALKDEADYIIASPTVEQGAEAEKTRFTAHGAEITRSGHQQVEVFEKILQNPDVAPRVLAMDFIETNAKEGRIRDEKDGKVLEYDVAPTLSAYSTAGVERLAAALDRMGADLLIELKKPVETKEEGFFSKGIAGFFKGKGDPPKAKSGLDKIMDVIGECKVLYSSKNKPLVDLKDFTEKACDKFYTKPEDKAFRQELSDALSGMSIADFRGTLHEYEVGTMKDKLMDQSQFGPMGAFIPGSIENPFTLDMIADARRTASKASNPIESYEFWERTLKDADKIGFSPEELTNVKKINSALDKYFDIDARKDPDGKGKAGQEISSLIKSGASKKAGIKKIWEYNYAKKNPDFENFKNSKNVPPNWKKFVLAIRDALTDDIFS